MKKSEGPGAGSLLWLWTLLHEHSQPRKPASYYLFVDAVNVPIPRREWRPKRKESSTDEETMDYCGTVAFGCGPGGHGRLCGGQYHLQYGAFPNGRDQQLPRRRQSPRERHHHCYGPASHGCHSKPCACEYGVRAVCNPAA